MVLQQCGHQIWKIVVKVTDYRIREELRLKIYWLIYLILLFLYKAAMIISVAKKGSYDFSITDIVYLIIFIGSLGFAFNRRIMNKTVWCIVFLIAFLLYFNTWIIVPAIWLFSNNISIVKIIFMMSFNIPFLPLLYIVYLYSWKSEKLWD